MYSDVDIKLCFCFARSYKQMSGGFDGTEYMEDAMDNNSQQEHQFADMVSIASDMCKAELTTTTPPAGSPGGGGGCPCFNGNGGVHHVHHQDHTSMAEPGGCKRRRSDDSSDAGVTVAADSDEHFALSCVAALRRLPVRKNAETRMRILHMLYEAEYGEQPAFR